MIRHGSDIGVLHSLDIDDAELIIDTQSRHWIKHFLV